MIPTQPKIADSLIQERFVALIRITVIEPQSNIPSSWPGWGRTSSLADNAMTCLFLKKIRILALVTPVFGFWTAKRDVDAMIYRGRDVRIKVLKGLTPGQKLTETALANIRREVDWQEKVAYWQEMIVANGWTQAQLAKVVGESTATVCKRLSLHDKATSQELALLMEKDKTKRLPFRALDILVRQFALPEDRRPWIEKLMAGMTVDVLEAELGTLRGKKKPKIRSVRAQYHGGSVMLPGEWRMGCRARILRPFDGGSQEGCQV